MELLLLAESVSPRVSCQPFTIVFQVHDLPQFSNSMIQKRFCSVFIPTDWPWGLVRRAGEGLEATPGLPWWNGKWCCRHGRGYQAFVIPHLTGNCLSSKSLQTDRRKGTLAHQPFLIDTADRVPLCGRGPPTVLQDSLDSTEHRVSLDWTRKGGILGQLNSGQLRCCSISFKCKGLELHLLVLIRN